MGGWVRACVRVCVRAHERVRLKGRASERAKSRAGARGREDGREDGREEVREGVRKGETERWGQVGIGGVVKLADFDELGRLGGERAQLADACSAPEVLRKVPTHKNSRAQSLTHSLTHSHSHMRPCHTERERSSTRHATMRRADASPAATRRPHPPIPALSLGEGRGMSRRAAGGGRTFGRWGAAC